jgi:hypothetical protein
MTRSLALVFLIAFSSGAAAVQAGPPETEPLTPDETEQVESLLETLYESFGHAQGGQPDWDRLRSVFVDGGQFVTEPPAGEAPKPQTVDAFISSWQASIRKSASPRPATQENIIGTRITKVGELIRVDVVFQAIKSDDPAPRKPGLDSLLLAKDGGDWKVLSFVVQYESKL